MAKRFSGAPPARRFAITLEVYTHLEAGDLDAAVSTRPCPPRERRWAGEGRVRGACRSWGVYRPAWLTPYSAWAWVKPSPASEVSCWMSPERENDEMSRYCFADSAACSFQSACTASTP